MITSTGNSTVVAAAKLHSGRERRKRRRTLLEGPHLIQAAATAGITPELYSLFRRIGGPQSWLPVPA